MRTQFYASPVGTRSRYIGIALAVSVALAGVNYTLRLLTIDWTYAYLTLSSQLMAIWALLYALRRDIRRTMLYVSLGTMFLGLTEPLFVPSYWNPLTLWNLARRTGFDIESLLFSFAIGGIVFAAYQVLFRVRGLQSIANEREHQRHRFHWVALACAPALFVVLVVTTRLNPIYSAAIALVGGFVATLYCRPDLWKKMLVSGNLFLVLYFVEVTLLDFVFPGYVAEVWNLEAISGIRVAAVPLEELMFAFAFGLYWSSMYEHLAWRRSDPS